MEVNEQNLQALAHYLQQTMSAEATVRKEAEQFLRSVEGQQGYPLLLLHAVSQGNIDMAIRLSAAITLKNVIKREWEVEGKSGKIHEADKVVIKEQIVEVMLGLPELIQKQISEAIANIGKTDFPEKWENLLPTMVAKFATGDFHIINGILRTAHPLFHKYRFEERSDSLWTEIKFVLDNFAAPLTELCAHTLPLIKTHQQNASALKVVYSSLLLIMELFYSLNYQDLPEYFEENMKTWMDVFLTLLQEPENPVLAPDVEENPGIMEDVKAQICENIALYAQKYDEEFEPHLPAFVTAVWHLLTSSSLELRYDRMVCVAMGFLAAVGERAHYKALFEQDGVLQALCEQVIVNNMKLRQADIEMYEDDAEEYIRRDMEGSDIDTRRRGACDLVRSLCTFHEQKVTGILLKFIEVLIREYATNPAANWGQKDAAVFLVTALAVKSKTSEKGTTKLNELVNVGEFFSNHILPELQDGNVNERPILKADAIKFVTSFRNQLPKAIHCQLLPMLINHLLSTSIVNSSYAAGCIERSFMVRQEGQPVFSQTEIIPVAGALLTNLFTALERPGNSENEYIMKAIMRTISTAKAGVAPFVGEIVKRLGALLAKCSASADSIPTKPRFSHYMFEVFACTIRHACAADVSNVPIFEKALFPAFENLLKFDIVEFQQYVFQLLAQLLEFRSPPMPGEYMTLFPLLLTPALWESGANTAPLVRLLKAYLKNGRDTLFPQEEVFQHLLGVFQKLIASPRNDHEGFNLLCSVVEYVPAPRVQPYLQMIFTLLFQRLQASKTAKFMKGMLVFTCLLCGAHGGALVVQTVDTIQPKLFSMLLNRLLENVQKVSGEMDRKTCAIGMVKLLTETPPMMSEYVELWPRLLEAVVRLFELPRDETVAEDDQFFDVGEPTTGYKATYAKLAYCTVPDHDPFPTIENPKVYLAHQMLALSSKHPGQLMPLIGRAPTPDVSQHLQMYCQMAGVALQ